MSLTRHLRAALATLALAGLACAANAGAKPATLQEADTQCLGCHAAEGLTKTFDRGDALSLQVDGDAFAKSVHAGNGCASCHAGIELAKHPGNAKSYKTKREFARQSVEACRGCHGEIFDAYASSSHGRLAEAGATPLCVDCHSAHKVDRASVGTHLRDNCLACHGNALEQHEKWLPNTKHHFDVVACSACHSPNAKRRIDLRIFETERKREASGRDPSLILTQGGGGVVTDPPIDPKRLRELVQGLNHDGSGRIMLVGRLEADNAVDAHRLAPKGQATKDCSSCHRKGADAFQNVTLSFIDGEGKRVRYATQKDVLHGPTSVDTVRGFYALGGTRIGILDVLLGLAVLGGVSAPIGHAVMRKLMRRKEKENA